MNHCGIEIASETNTHFLCYCPFHNNTDSPALAVDKVKGLWTCFNPSCKSRGTLKMLLGRLKGLNQFEASRFLMVNNRSSKSVTERLKEVRKEKFEFIQFPPEPVERMKNDFWLTDSAISYMRDERKMDEDTLRYFEIGYSVKNDMVIVPMHDPSGMLIGFVGRSIKGKVFKNTKRLPKSETAWNFHRAKKHGETVIIVESSFDAMRVHQAGYPNVIALLGGHLSKYHTEQINRTFSNVIIMTDFDLQHNKVCNVCRAKCKGHRPGRDLGRQIVNALPNKRVRWAAYDDTCVYPHNAKDVGDMSDDEIRQALKNSISNFNYVQWGIENVREPIAS